MRPFNTIARLGAASVVGLSAPAAALSLEAGTHAAPAETITIVLTGDTGFSGNATPVHPDGVYKYGRRQSWREAVSGIAPVIDGDINFTNIETVVTERNDLRRDTKGQRGPYNFRSHPNAIRHLVTTGFNVLSLANNHSMDYGLAGLEDSIRHVESMRGDGLLAWAGVGANREEASRPQVIAVNGARVAFSAIGIVTHDLARHRAADDKPGQISYRHREDFDLTLDRLARQEAGYRMLSIHYGTEAQVRADDRQIREWRGAAVAAKGIDLVVGHHAHVVRAVERVGDSVIFYGLGNFLHHGTADIRGRGVCRDYGLVAKVHLARQSGGRYKAKAVEAIPVTLMHTRTEPLPPRAAHDRIGALNYLAAVLPPGDGAEGMQFHPREDGTGLYCFAGADSTGGRIGELCRGWTPKPQIPAAALRRYAPACSR